MLENALVAVAVLVSLGTLWLASRIAPVGRAGLWFAGRTLSLSQVAKIYEQQLAGLVRVTIAVPRIEDPAEDPALKQAVMDNFARGVVYLFLVSKERYQIEMRGSYQIFRAYAQDALMRNGLTDAMALESELARLVRIVPLRADWNHKPYIFYHCVVGNLQYAYAFRGGEREQGIAQRYETVGREDGAVIYEMVRDQVDPTHAQLIENDLGERGTREFAAAPARPPLTRTLKLVKDDSATTSD